MFTKCYANDTNSELFVQKFLNSPDRLMSDIDGSDSGPDRYGLARSPDRQYHWREQMDF